MNSKEIERAEPVNFIQAIIDTARRQLMVIYLILFYRLLFKLLLKIDL